MAKAEILPGSETELGATVRDDGVNFALFSGAAERVELCLFDPSGKIETARIELPGYSNEVWHGFVPGMVTGQLYGYRVHGRHAPEEGLRFNPNKLLIDPYAKQLQGEILWDKSVYGHDQDVEGADSDLSLSDADSAANMPKCVVSDFRSEGAIPDRPSVPWDRTVIYETHVRGFTMLHPRLSDNVRGTFDGLRDDEIVKYIKGLGVTTVELLPVHAFVDDHTLHQKGLRNHWGYNTVNFFAPMQRYQGRNGLASFRDMVRRYHDVGIEVILDVVYNHTAEGNEQGAMLSFRGIDNAAYYRLMPDTPRFYINDTGTGNTINASHPRVVQLMLDSLRYWVETMEVDGFRFDLGTILGRDENGYSQRRGFFDAVGQDPVLKRVKLISEPWDIGPGGYQVGEFPPGWAEWNDKYRDTVRSYWKGDEGKTRDLAARVAGSGDIYDKRGRAPWATVNFITAHDGFTLHDLVSYNEKHNDANGEDNKDGHGNNMSFNHGAEGPTDDVGILEIRERQKRNLLATLLLSHGTPMLLAGDEFGRSQDGNNNAYCQDNEIGWTRWDQITDHGGALSDFVRKLTQFRADHAIFRRLSFRDGCVIRWLHPEGEDQTDDHWNDAGAATLAWHVASPVEQGQQEVLVIFNARNEDVDFQFPERVDMPWAVVLDTARPNDEPASSAPQEKSYKVAARSLVVMF